MAKGNLRAKAFQLFNEGKDSSSPEIKALGLKGGTRYTYYDNWKKFKATGGETPKTEKVKLPGGAIIGAYKPEIVEVNEKPIDDELQDEVGQEAPAQGISGEAKELENEHKIPINLGGDGHGNNLSIPGKVVGTGIPVSVVLSLKSLSFWEVVHSIDRTLTLDNFIDDCIEDFFNGRGKDLGLIEIGGQNV